MSADRDDPTSVLPGTEGTTGGSEESTEEPFVPPTSPVELAAHRFPRTLFGYRTRDVDAHLMHLAREWEGLLLPSRTAMGIVTAAVERAEGRRPYESLGEDISSILLAARTAADAARSQGEQELAAARQEVQETLSALEAERDRVLAATQQERSRMLAEAEAERERILAGARAEHDRLVASNIELRSRLAGIVDEVAPLLASAPDLPPPTVEPVAAQVEQPAPERPAQEPSKDGLALIESVMAPKSGSNRRRSR